MSGWVLRALLPALTFDPVPSLPIATLFVQVLW